MFYIFYGTDTQNARIAARDFIEKLHSQKPDTAYIEMDAESFSIARAEELLSSRGLFGAPSVTFLDNVLESKEALDFFEGHIKRFRESPNIFIALEKKISAPLLKKFQTHAEKVGVFESREKKQKEFTAFPLADAVGARDRKRAWVLLHEAFREGLAPEQIHGTLFWGIKNMLLVKQEGARAPLPPFVLRKSQTFAKNYTEEELKKLSSTLIALYHDAHRGKIDLAIGLEQLALKI